MATRARDIFEKLSHDTWRRLSKSRTYMMSQSEETITEINLLAIAEANFPNIRIVPTSKPEEAKKGTDWEWWIGNSKIGWLRYAVQAKKVSSRVKAKKVTPENARYDVLAHKVKNKLQLDILESYAAKNRAIPLYCFYNFLNSEKLQLYWHCNELYDMEQLGCTICPSQTVRSAIRQKNNNNFAAIHKSQSTLLWRCIVSCPLMLLVYEGKSNPFNFDHIFVYQELPSFLQATSETDEIVDFPPDYYDSDLGVYPQHLLVVDTGIGDVD